MLLAALIGWIVLVIEMATLVFGILLIIGNKRVNSSLSKYPFNSWKSHFRAGRSSVVTNSLIFSCAGKFHVMDMDNSLRHCYGLLNNYVHCCCNEGALGPERTAVTPCDHHSFRHLLRSHKDKRY